MGIKGLNKLIKINSINSVKISNIRDLKGKIIAIDAELLIHKINSGKPLIKLINNVIFYLKNKIIPIYIFDGGTLQEKENTNLLRYQKKIISKLKLEKIEEQIDYLNDNELENKDELLLIKKKLEKNSTKINLENINVLLELFDLLNIPYIFSYGEGEYLAVLLNKYNIIDFFLTDDTDPIPAGINKTIKFYNNSVYYLETKMVYDALKLSPKQLCDLCILFGSDYSVFNHGLKTNEIYELIIKFKSIEEIIKNNMINCIDNNSLLLIDKIRNIYFNSDNLEKNLFIKNNKFFDITCSTNESNDNYNINSIIDHSNMLFYSNVMLEYWDDFICIISIEINLTNQNEIIDKSNMFKYNICKYINESKFNIKNIIKFIKKNITDITNNEIENIITSFEFLNSFGIF